MFRTTASRMKTTSVLVAALLSSTVVITRARPASAGPLIPEEFDKAKKFIEKGLKPFQLVNSIKGVLEFLNIIQGEDLSNQLSQVEARLIEEIQFYVNVELDAATTAAHRKFHEILRNPGQTTLNRERITFLTGSSSSNDASDVYAELERLIWDNRDLERSMRLATPLNELAVIMGEAMVWHDRYFPEEAPFVWASFNEHYGRTYRANYSLVKVSRVMCYPGFNLPLGDLVMDRDFVFRTSRLYKKRENKGIQVGTTTCGNLPERLFQYNPVTNILTSHCPTTETNVNINGLRFPTMNRDAQAAAWARANDLAQREFRTADDVAAVRDYIQNLRFLNGGDETNGIDGDLNNHEFLDPWVEEPLCANGYAYVQRP